MSEPVANNKVVTIHYTLRNDAGEVLDSSEDAGPMAYLHGFGNIVPGLEKQLDGKIAGDKLVAVVPPEEGYGDKQAGGAQAIPREAFEGVDVHPGMTLVVEDDDGEQMPLRVVAVEEDRVLVDLDHPLAGETLHFTVEVISVREATEEELTHGHVHDGHGHHH